MAEQEGRHETTPQYVRRRWSSLRDGRRQWLGVWREIQAYYVPDMGVLDDGSTVSDGRRRDKLIRNSTATRALRTLAAGLYSGMSSPSQPWLEFQVTSEELRYRPDVVQWLSDVRRNMLEVFASGNVYRSLHMVFEEMSAFGIGTAVMMPDPDKVVRLHVLTAGTYAVGIDDNGDVDTLYRRSDMTIEQMVNRFGLEKCSRAVQNLYRQRQYDERRPVIHAIEPRKSGERRGRPGALGMPWQEVYLEEGSQEGDAPLFESGYRMFNVLAPRWIVAGDNVYGTSPARDALGDVKQLQLQELRYAQAVDYQTKPPLQGPAGLKANNSALLPGGYAYLGPLDGGSQGIREIFQAKLNLDHLTRNIEKVEARIKSTFYEDLFRVATDLDKSGVTARQIVELHAEKLMQLGPVLERVQNELLQPLVAYTFSEMQRTGRLPEPPSALQGQGVNVEFVSILAQAQKQAGAGAIDRFIGTVGSIAPVMPAVIDKLAGDEIVDEYARILSISPRLVRSGEELEELRVRKAQAEQAQMQVAQEQQQADIDKTRAQAQAAAARGQGPGGSVPQGMSKDLDIARFLGP